LPSSRPTQSEDAAPRLRRTLSLWNLVIIGIILIQPTAPMPLFGVVYDKAHGHVVTTILIAMAAMLLTAFSYGRMARAYPSAGSAFTYVGREIHPALGYVTGWSMAMEYLMNPLICCIWCAEGMVNDPMLSGILPKLPLQFWVVFFALLFTFLNLHGIRTTARINEALAVVMGAVILVFFAAAAKYLAGHGGMSGKAFVLPFYNPETFSLRAVLTGTSLAALTFIGFDGISTLSEEVKNPRRNILLATVLTCLVTGLLAALQVYVAQLVWPAAKSFPNLETAYSYVAGFIGGPWLFSLVNLTLLVANIGSGMGSQLAAARLLYGMGCGNALPKSFFGAIDAKRGIPGKNVLLAGAIALVGGLFLSYDFGAQMVNFGAFIAFMGVNLAALIRYYVRAEEKRVWSNLVPPALGFAICLLIFLSLESPAKFWGGAWVAAGLLYGAWRTRGFRGGPVDFELPPE
jgi:amino acid transporter